MSKSIQKAAWIAFVVLAVGVVFYAVQRSGDEPGDAGASAEASSDPQPVEILKYSDYQCPACKMYIPLQNQLKSEFGDMLTIEYRHFPLSGHAYAELAARAVEAASEQGSRKEMHDKVFDGQEEWSQGDAGEIFRGYAEEIGLDLNQYEEDIESEEVRQRVQSQKAEGERRQVRATPTFFINGRKLQQNPQSYEQFRAIVEMVMYQ